MTDTTVEKNSEAAVKLITLKVMVTGLKTKDGRELKVGEEITADQVDFGPRMFNDGLISIVQPKPLKPIPQKPHGKVLVGKRWMPVISSSIDGSYHERLIDDEEPESEAHHFWEFYGHRTLVGVEIHQSNSVKAKWGDIEVTKGGSCKIFFNKIQVYRFGASDVQYMLRHAAWVIDALLDHSAFNWQEGKPFSEIVGRKVFYDRVPSIVERVDDWGSVYLKPDGDFTYPEPVYHLESEDEPEWEFKDWMKDDILSSKIWWWRDTKEPKEAREKRAAELKAKYVRIEEAPKPRERIICISCNEDVTDTPWERDLKGRDWCHDCRMDQLDNLLPDAKAPEEHDIMSHCTHGEWADICEDPECVAAWHKAEEE